MSNSWSAPLEFAPIVLPDGRKLVTLGDAGAYVEKHHPKAQDVAAILLRASESPNQFYCHCARQAVSRLVQGDQPTAKPQRTTWRDRRKSLQKQGS